MNPNASYTFTVFTPAFNSERTLHRGCESLRSQTFRDFEWLIVDDGSTDQTRRLVESWQATSGFPIRYLYQENSGKHIAFNLAVAEAQGRLFLNLDSDDACVPRALETFLSHWNAISEPTREGFCGVTGLCVNHNGELVGTPFPKDVLDSDSLEIRYRYKVRGEKWGFQRTDVLRQFPFPELQRRHYVPEGLVWDKIARRYKTRFVNERLRIYYMDKPSMVHGQPAGKNAAGGQMQHANVLNDEVDYLRFAPFEFLRSAVHFVRFSFHTGTGIVGQWRALHNLRARLLWVLMLPVGWMVFQRDRRK